MASANENEEHLSQPAGMRRGPSTNRWYGGAVSMFPRLALTAVLCAVLTNPVIAGDVRGRAVLAGQPPAAKKVPVTIDQYVCGADKESEDLIVSAAREIKNVVVWIDNPPAATPSP